MSERMQFDESEIRHEARRRIANGLLPCEHQQHMWAGTGDGQLCSICDRPITANQIEYELQFNGDPQAVFRFHRICHQVWELECIR